MRDLLVPFTVATMTLSSRRRAADTTTSTPLVLLPVVAALLLTGCSSDPAPTPEVPSSVGKVTTQERPRDPLDCSAAPLFSITVVGGESYTPDSQASLIVSQPVRIVIDSDIATTVDLRGSETFEVVDIDPGVSSICTTYLSAGQYAVQVGELIPLVFTVS